MKKEKAFDRIFIRALRLKCLIGINPEERRKRQDVVIHVVLEGDFGKACASDRIEDAANYRAVSKSIISLVKASSFFLVEKLAQSIASLCLEDKKVRRVKVTVEKPGALRFSRSVGIEITRENGRL